MLVFLMVFACAPKLPIAPATPPQLRPMEPLPLHSGLSWTWTVEERTPQGRALLVFRRPDKVQSVATQTFELSSVDEGRARAVVLTDPPVQGMTARTDLSLWHEGDDVWMDRGQGPELALDIARPPFPVSTERVPCVVHFLDDAAGFCSPAPGGPMGQWPLLDRAVLQREVHTGAALVSLFVSIATIGLFSPGGGVTQTSVVLEEFEDTPDGPYTGNPSALFAAFKDGRGWGEKRVRRALATGPVNREEVAALVVGLHGEYRSESMASDAIRLGLPLLHNEERYSVIRALLQVSEPDVGLGYLLVGREGFVADHAPEQRDALALALGQQHEVGLCLLDRGCGFSERALNGTLFTDEPVPSPGIEDAGVVSVFFARTQTQVIERMMTLSEDGLRADLLLAILAQLDAFERDDVWDDYSASVGALTPVQEERLQELLGSEQAK